MVVMPPACRCRLFAALGFATLTAAASTPATAQDVFPRRDGIPEFLQRRLDADMDEDGEALAVEDVVRFSLRAGDLSVTSTIKNDVSGQRQIRLRGMPGMTRVQVGTRFRGPMGITPFFELNHTQFAEPDGGVAVQTRIAAQGGSMRLERTARVGDVTTRVSFSQGATFSRRGRFEPRDAGAGGGAGERVRLRANSSQPVAPASPPEDSWEAPTFAELLRKYPGPVARYLGPLFRDFGQDAEVFRVDARLGWQLFPDAVESNEATSAAIAQLVDRLDADDFRERERATAELEALGGPAMLALADIDRGPLSPEQNTRIDAILSRYAQLDESEAAALLDDAEFLLRCFTYCDLEPLRAAAAKALSRKLADDELGLDATAKLPDRVRAADVARERPSFRQ
jgi:hypothetical protein